MKVRFPQKSCPYISKKQPKTFMLKNCTDFHTTVRKSYCTNHADFRTSVRTVRTDPYDYMDFRTVLFWAKNIFFLWFSKFFPAERKCSFYLEKHADLFFLSCCNFLLLPWKSCPLLASLPRSECPFS